MSKLIISMATENILPYCGEIIQTHKEYAAARGYEYTCHRELHADFRHLHPYYSRLGFLLDAMRPVKDSDVTKQPPREVRQYDRVVCVDADVAFMDYTRDIGDVIDDGYVSVGRYKPDDPLDAIPHQEQEPGYWLAGYNQTNWPTTYLCFGLLVYRNNWVSRAFLQEVHRRCLADPDVDTARDQYYGYDVLAMMGYAGVRGCTPEQIGCFCKELWHDDNSWSPSCPTVHLSASGDNAWQRRQQIFRDVYLPQIKRG